MVGVCFVDSSLSFEALREVQNCGTGCDVCARRHSAECRLNPHAVGPTCNMITGAVRLKDPVPCGGKLGCWRLPSAVRTAVEAQLGSMRGEDLEARSWSYPEPFSEGCFGPYFWPFPWMCEADGSCNRLRFPPVAWGVGGEGVKGGKRLAGDGVVKKAYRLFNR